MIIAGSEKEIDDTIEALAIVGCQVCPAKEKCRAGDIPDQDDELTCGEIIRRTITILKTESLEEEKEKRKWQSWECFLLGRFLAVQ